MKSQQRGNFNLEDEALSRLQVLKKVNNQLLAVSQKEKDGVSLLKKKLADKEREHTNLLEKDRELKLA